MQSQKAAKSKPNPKKKEGNTNTISIILDENQQQIDAKKKSFDQQNTSQLDQKWAELKIVGKNISRRSYHSANYYNDNLYIYGGYEVNQGILADFIYLQIQNSQVYKWQPVHGDNLANYPGPRVRHSTIVYKDKLYLFGGKINTLQNTNKILTFDFKEVKWEEIQYKPDQEIPPPIDSHSVTLKDNLMFVFGGFTTELNGGFSNKLWSFNLDTQDWKQYKSQDQNNLPKARLGSSITIIGDKIYMFGGTNIDTKFDDLWSFDINASTWTRIESQSGNLPITRNGHSLLTYKDKLILFGGIHFITHEKNDLYTFDPATIQWTLVDSDTSHQKEELDDEDVVSQQENQVASKSNHNNKSISKNSKIFINPSNSYMMPKPKKTQYITLKTQQNESKSLSQEEIQLNESAQLNQLEENKKRRQLQKKMMLLSEFELNEEEKRIYKPNSPTTETMKNSIQQVGNPLGGKSKSLKNLDFNKPGLNGGFDNANNKIIGRRPCARDGQTAVIIGQYCYIFGGDRHLMAYNDIYMVDLDQVINQKQ